MMSEPVGGGEIDADYALALALQHEEEEGVRLALCSMLFALLKGAALGKLGRAREAIAELSRAVDLDARCAAALDAENRSEAATITQVVNLGAGLDARAFRGLGRRANGPSFAGCDVFEVDFEDVLRAKALTAAALGVAFTALHAVAVFLTLGLGLDDALEALNAGPADDQEPEDARSADAEAALDLLTYDEMDRQEEADEKRNREAASTHHRFDVEKALFAELARQPKVSVCAGGRA